MCVYTHTYIYMYIQPVMAGDKAGGAEGGGKKWSELRVEVGRTRR